MQVERTRSRPVASGVLTPFQGLTFLGFQLLLGLGILLQLNNYRFVSFLLDIILFFPKFRLAKKVLCLIYLRVFRLIGSFQLVS